MVSVLLQATDNIQLRKLNKRLSKLKLKYKQKHSFEIRNELFQTLCQIQNLKNV